MTTLFEGTKRYLMTRNRHVTYKTKQKQKQKKNRMGKEKPKRPAIIHQRFRMVVVAGTQRPAPKKRINTTRQLPGYPPLAPGNQNPSAPRIRRVHMRVALTRSLVSVAWLMVELKM
jgi:hypothetical protein